MVVVVTTVFYFSLISWSSGREYEWDDDNRLRPYKTASFWQCVAQYPMHRTHIPPQLETDFLSALAYGSNERVLDVKNTTFPYEDVQVARLIQVYQDLRALRSDPACNPVPAIIWHIARTMESIESARSRYYYGTPSARRYRDIAIPRATWEVAVCDLIMGLILWGAQKNYRTRLQATVPGRIISVPDFRRLMMNLMAEWVDSNLVATVFVSVNVGFLAVPDITSFQRGASLVSALFSMTSIITGLHHVWQHRGKQDAEFEDARMYLYRLHMFGRRKLKSDVLTPLDLTPTACFLALPLATLQWAVLTFTLSITAYGIQCTLQGSHVRIVLGALIGFLAFISCGMFLFFWQIWQGPKHREMEEGLDRNVVDDSEPKGWRDLLSEAWRKHPQRIFGSNSSAASSC
ncbi:hypothetical protein C8J57DRAFT_386060 [Mycena rebaudengoi]|nr:hypothetical protein C8J57DRAFT_386060 [Mycena rebaudengoi]